MALVSASYHLPVRSEKGAKFVPCKCTGMVTVVTHTHYCVVESFDGVSP